MKRALWGCVSVVVGLGLVVAAAPAQAQQAPFDHLKCYKIKEKRAFLAPVYNADLVPEQKPLFSDENCNIKMKAKLFCIDVQKTNVAPNPPGAPPGPQASDYLCYTFKKKCSPKIPNKGISVDVTDQFSSGNIIVKKAGMLCVPATKKMTTTTTSSTSTTSSSSTSSSTITSTTTSTTLVSGDCQQIGTNPPLCGGLCVIPGEVCVWVPSIADCRCGSTTTTTTTKTTSTTSSTSTTLPAFTCDPAVTQAPECDGTCPPGQICMAPGTCQNTTSPCLSDADCDASQGPCMHGPCDCLPSIGVACGGIGAPECYGDCNPNEVCRVVNVTSCQCF